jgi:hypothetical protein
MLLDLVEHVAESQIVLTLMNRFGGSGKLEG